MHGNASIEWETQWEVARSQFERARWVFTKGGVAGGYEIVGSSRLRKGAGWAGQLAHTASAVCDTQGALEAEAYAAWMHGNALMEGETQWEAAHSQLGRVRWVSPCFKPVRVIVCFWETQWATWRTHGVQGGGV
jgi:hypothetical protein